MLGRSSIVFVRVKINKRSFEAFCVWIVCVVDTVQGCVHVCLYFAVGVGSSGVCMFHVLILIFILVLNCEVL